MKKKALSLLKSRLNLLAAVIMFLVVYTASHPVWAVIYPGEEFLPMHGGGGSQDGVTHYQRRCADNQVLKGLLVYVGASIMRPPLHLVCMPVMVDGKEALSSYPFPMIYLDSPVGRYPFNQNDCPAGETVMGISGRSGWRIDNLTLKCGRLGASSDITPIILSQGTTVTLGGGTGGDPFSDTCPNNKPARGVSVSFKENNQRVWEMNTFQLICGLPPKPMQYGVLSAEFDRTTVYPGDSVKVTVTLRGPAGKNGSDPINFRLINYVNGTYSEDYDAYTTLTIPKGQTKGSISLTIKSSSKPDSYWVVHSKVYDSIRDLGRINVIAQPQQQQQSPAMQMQQPLQVPK